MHNFQQTEQTDIKVIASAFEEVFNISLGDYYRTFQDMRIRKRSQTPFLDHLREKFTYRISDGLK
ncbi:MAG: RteC domain-containing protein [Bacteroidota bacterium]